MAQNMSNLKILRNIIKELRHFTHKSKIRDLPAFNFTMDQYRRYRVTDKKYCRGELEMRHMGQTYLCLLQSVRKQEELSEQYKGSGERSVEAAAGLVGLRLPEKPEDT